MASASFTAPDTEQPPAAPTAQHKRHMATLTKIEGFLKVDGTPYVVLSVDGPVDVKRLAAALGMTDAAAQGLLDATYDEQTLLEHVTTPQDEGFVTTLPESPSQQDDPDDDDGGVDEDEPETPQATTPEIDPETRILTYLTTHGPSDAQTIAAATGIPRSTGLGTILVQLMSDKRIVKNGLAYAATDNQR